MEADYVFKCYGAQDLCNTTGEFELDEDGEIITDPMGMNTRKELTRLVSQYQNR